VSEWPRRRWIKFASTLAMTAPLGRSPAFAAADRARDSAADATSALDPVDPSLLPSPIAPVQRAAAPGTPIPLTQFEPRSMLHVRETHIERPRYPVVDLHAHLTFSNQHEDVRMLAPGAELVPAMDRCDVKVMINLTGGRGTGLARVIDQYDRKFPGRFLSFTEPWWGRASEADYAKFQADQIEAAHRAGARGLKVLKTLGLYLRDPKPGEKPTAEHAATGPLVKVDDPRFDPMWEACGALGMPVAIHISDPEAFFLPIDRFNERYEELYHHPDWSFHGADFPTHDDLMAACDRVFARHPKTTFVALHVGHDAENLERVSQRLDRFPNMHVDLGARIGELGRQPRTAKKFFDRHQDRILFGTDATPNGVEFPQQLFGEALYRIYFRFLETEDEYFDYAPAAIPPQGRWKIYGLGLSDEVLKKVYHQNAVRLLKLPW
jgi:predicted TIM-barrel fold metal-dependent hydrolase